MLIRIRYWYYRIIGQRKLYFKLILEDGSTVSEWIDKDIYQKRIREIHIEHGIITERKDPEKTEYVWSLVGNVIDYLQGKEDGKHGTKHFRSGAKVYCFPPLWGDGYEHIKVIGLPRRSPKRITIVIKSNRISNWRVEKVYDPIIIKQMILNGGWDDSDTSLENAQSLCDSLIERSEAT